MPHRHCWIATLVCVVGCGGADSVDVGDAPTPLQAAAQQARAITTAAEQAADVASTTEPQARPTPAEPVDAYQPPYPDRLDPFQAPKQSARVARRAVSDGAESVILLGFAALDEPQALLSIDGAIKPMGPGDEVAGVQVLSITPPRAVLQRGQTRWTATIE